MKLLLLLCSMLVLPVFLSNPAQAANDTLVVTPTPGVCCWTFEVRNRNSQQLAINRIQLDVKTANASVESGSGPSTAGWGEAQLSNGDLRALYTTTGSSVNSGQTLKDFQFCLAVPTQLIDKPITVAYTTYNNTTVLSTGNLSLICTPVQNNAPDSIKVKSSQVGTDPCFDFTIYNRNGFFPIHSASFELLGASSGTVRPSSIQTPIGWKFDSTTAYRAYFSAENTSLDIQTGESLGGFRVCLRANPAVTKFTFVARTNESTVPLTRDTIRNIAATASANTQPSCDTVTVAKNLGCLYSYTLSNFHALNAQPPGRITSFAITSKTPSVKITSAPTKPANWDVTIRGDTSAFFTARSESNGIPSGKTENNFKVVFSNDQGVPFIAKWETFSPLGSICSGTNQLTCAPELPATDTVTVQDDIQACCFKTVVKNRHNTPPSNLLVITLEVPQGSGVLTGSNSSLSWTATSDQAKRTLRYQAPTGVTPPYQATGDDQSLFYCFAPTNPAASTTVTWTTYDNLAATTPIATGTFKISCTPPNPDCDSVWVEVVDQNSCKLNVHVMNKKSGEKTINRVVINSLDGHLVADAANIIGWDKTIDPGETFVTYTSSTGIPAGIEGPFGVTFKGTSGAPEQFRIAVTATDNDQASCFDTVKAACLVNGVSLEASIRSSLVLSPNPVKGQSTIRFTLPNTASIHLSVIDLLGREVQVIESTNLGAGDHVLTLNATNLAAGSYYVRLDFGSGVVTRKIIITK